jgi:hypothetical protein
MNPQDFVRKLALKLKMHKVGGTAVHHVALLIRALEAQGTKSEMVRGYCVIPATKEACDHYWVRTEEGLDLDVAFEVAKLRSPELETLHPVLLETLPEGLVRSDKDEILIRDENERLFELFRSDQKKFWLESPTKKFRV